MISYLGSLVQFSPAAGRAGRCRQMSLWMGSTCHVPARQPEVLAASPSAPFPSAASCPGSQRFARTLPGCGSPFPTPRRAARAARGLCGLSMGVARLFPPWQAARAARGLAPSPRARRAFSLRSPSTRRRSGLRKSFDRNWGLFAVWEGVASLGLSLPLSLPPCLLPPAGMGWLFSGVSQSLCFANRWQCVRAS